MKKLGWRSPSWKIHKEAVRRKVLKKEGKLL